MERVEINASMDIETTGLESGIHEIIQLAIIIYKIEKRIDCCNNFIRIKDSFITNIRPMRPETIDQEALDVNGFTINELKKAPNPTQVRNTFFNWYEEVTYNAVIKPLGHGFSFDMSFLKIFFGDNYKHIFNRNFNDTKVVASYLKEKGVLQYDQDISLKSLCLRFNLVEKDYKFHGAEADALATIK